MPGMLDNKVIIVTGGGGAIGGGIARLAAAQGARVVVNDIGGSVDGDGADAGPAQRMVDEIRAAGGQAVASTDSVASWDGAQAMVQTALDAFGRVDGVVNNAGILRDGIFHKMSPQDFEAVIQVHLFGSFYLSRAVAPLFREQGGGAFVHMTSTSGLIGNVGQANYAAAKLGIVGLSKSIALDMARFNVTSNCISPFAWSRLIGTIPMTDDAQRARIAKIQTMTPAKIAPLAVALASDAGKSVTGQILGVRNNKIYLMSQSRPLRSVHTGDGWTPEGIIATAFPAMEADFYPLDRSQDVFSWDPI